MVSTTAGTNNTDSTTGTLVNPHICVCKANLWCNQRVIKSVMSLRCFECKANRKLNKNQVWYEWKCDTFHKTSKCPLGNKCPKIHIYYSKMQARNAALDKKQRNSDTDSSSTVDRLPRKTAVSRISNYVSCSPPSSSSSYSSYSSEADSTETMDAELLNSSGALDPYSSENFSEVRVHSALCNPHVKEQFTEDMAVYLTAVA